MLIGPLRGVSERRRWDETGVYLVDCFVEGKMKMDSGVAERALVLHGGAGITWRWKVHVSVLSSVLDGRREVSV